MPIDAPRFNCGETPEGTPRRAAAVVTYIAEVHRDHVPRLAAPDEPEGI
ncbi:hypothetical protein [Streptomyces mirabilis]